MGRRLRSIMLVSAAVAGLQAAPAWAAAGLGSLDPFFGGGQVVLTDIGTNDGVNSVAVQPDGKVVVAGEATIGGRKDFAIVRHLPDGSLDPSFGAGGIVVIPIADGSSANSVRLSPDGTILVSGTAVFGGIPHFAVARITAEGSPDATFGGDGVVTQLIGRNAIAMVALPGPDGKVIVGGTAQTSAIGPTRMSKLSIVAIRLSANGDLDSSFGNGGVAIAPGPAADMGLMLDGEGRPVLFGLTADLAGVNSFAAARFTTDGRPDTSFGGDGSVTVPVLTASSATGAVLEPDGSPVLVGPAWDGREKVLAVARLGTDGELDPGFGENGVAASRVGGIGANGAIRQPDGRIVVAMTGGMTAIRLDPDGSLDETFGAGGISSNPIGDVSAANGVALGPGGEVVLGGAAVVGGTFRFATARIIGAIAETPPPATAEAPAEEPQPVDESPSPPIADDALPGRDEPLPAVDEPLPVVDEPLPVVDEPLPVVDEPAPPGDPAPPAGEDPSPPPTVEPPAPQHGKDGRKRCRKRAKGRGNHRKRRPGKVKGCRRPRSGKSAR